MSDSVRAVVTLVFFVQLVLIVGGSADVMRRCHAAFRVWGAGDVGTGLNWGTAFAAISWTITLTGWCLMFVPHLELAGVAFVLLGQFVALVSIVAKRRAYDALRDFATTE